MACNVPHPLREQDAEIGKETRDATNRTFEILKQHRSLDTFLGRKTQEPFPNEDEALPHG